jgi:urease accessory protein
MPARSQLEVKAVGGRSVVTGAAVTPPLGLLAPRRKSGAAWVYQSSLGGGFVGRDDVELEVHVERGATLFLSSQASSKVYQQAEARFRLEAHVEPQGTLAWWPDPVACFKGSALRQGLSFSLGSGARLLCVDAYCAGRVSRGERWAFGRMELDTRIDLEGRPLLRDGLLLDPRHGPLEQRLSGFEAFATAVLVGMPAPDVPAKSVWPWGTVLRFAAPTVEALTLALRDALRPVLLELLGEDPFARKW